MRVRSGGGSGRWSRCRGSRRCGGRGRLWDSRYLRRGRCSCLGVRRPRQPAPRGFTISGLLCTSRTQPSWQPDPSHGLLYHAPRTLGYLRIRCVFPHRAGAKSSWNHRGRTGTIELLETEPTTRAERVGFREDGGCRQRPTDQRFDMLVGQVAGTDHGLARRAQSSLPARPWRMCKSALSWRSTLSSREWAGRLAGWGESG